MLNTGLNCWQVICVKHKIVHSLNEDIKRMDIVLAPLNSPDNNEHEKQYIRALV